MCTKNEDCFAGADAINYYCAEGHCLEAGSCFSDADCINPSNSLTLPEPLCLDPTPDPYFFCDTNHGQEIGTCQQGCRETPCADGSVPVRCLADPCEVNQICGDVCIPDYCGGCNTIQFDAAGFLVNCTATDDLAEENLTSPTLNSTCETSDDCVGGVQYCSSDGFCTALGSCEIDVDCVMLGNIYPVPLFRCASPQVDYMTCGNGRCQKTCVDICKTSDECVGGQYCSSEGVCTDLGSCGNDSDCLMPGNLYPVDAFACEYPLVEYMSCQDDGRCHKTCVARRLLRSVTPQP